MDFDKPKVYGDTSITDGLVDICKGWGGLVRELLAVDWLLALSAHSSSLATVSSTPSWLPYTSPPPPSPSPPACLPKSLFHANQYVRRKSWVSLCALTAKRHLLMGKSHAKMLSLRHSHWRKQTKLQNSTMQRLWTYFSFFEICFRFNFVQPGWSTRQLDIPSESFALYCNKQKTKNSFHLSRDLIRTTFSKLVLWNGDSRSPSIGWIFQQQHPGHFTFEAEPVNTWRS